MTGVLAAGNAEDDKKEGLRLTPQAPRIRSISSINIGMKSGCDLLFDLANFRSDRVCANFNATRLHRLGDLTLQRYGQQPIGQLRARDLDVFCQLKTPYEGAIGDPPMQVLTFNIGFSFAFDDKHVLLGGDIQFVPLEPGDRHGDAVTVIGKFDRVKRGPVIGRLGLGRFEQIKSSLEPDTGAMKGREIKHSAHAISSCEQYEKRTDSPRRVARRAGPVASSGARF